jgi:hypothetical protein
VEDHNSGFTLIRSSCYASPRFINPENNGLSFHDLEVLKRGTGLEVVGKVSFEAN